MVVTVDAQLFYSVLQALPYLVNYPYECTEQTLNRFVSTGIVSSLFRDYPAVAKMAAGDVEARHAARDLGRGRPEPQDGARGDAVARDARRAAATRAAADHACSTRASRKAEREAALAKLRKAQTASGGFPWWPGGPPSPYMTLYILHGFANALEFGVDVPKDMVQKAWALRAALTSGETLRRRAWRTDTAAASS